MTDKLIRTVIALVLYIGLFACSSLSTAPAPSAAEIEKEEQAIYTFFLPDTGSPVLILEKTSSDISSDNPDQTIDYVKSGLDDISKETINSFLERNAEQTKLSADMDLVWNTNC